MKGTDEKTVKSLIEKAFEAAEKAYSPYSDFKVGAALLSKEGRVYQGCNIENSSYPATICAERTAMSKAISEGDAEFEAIAVVGYKNGKAADFCPPCGVCRQFMSEFCGADFKIILAKSAEEYKVYTLSELLPLGFKL